MLLPTFLLLLIISGAAAKCVCDEEGEEEEYLARLKNPSPAQIKTLAAEVFPEANPAPLGAEETKWMLDRHRLIIQKAVNRGANEWERLQKIAELFYEQHHFRRNQSQKALENYCTTNMRRLIGDVNVDRLMYLYTESATPEHLQSAFASMISRIRDDEISNQAEQYATFCKKILRIVSLEPAAMMDWLNDEQRAQIQLLIINKEISDDVIYERVYEFFNETVDKAEPQETINSACRRFIADLFGDDIVEEIEDLKDQHEKPQIIASKLHQHINEVEIRNKDTDRVYGKSVWLCERIYVAYNGICECGGRAETCDDTQSCIECRGNTEGAMCQRCQTGYEWSFEGDRCVEKCACNGHSIDCDDFGTCQNCTDNTVGKHCETCEDGFIGNARGGTEADCAECNCRLDQQCVLNADGVVECITPLEAIFDGDYGNDTDVSGGDFLDAMAASDSLAKKDDEKVEDDVNDEQKDEVVNEEEMAETAVNVEEEAVEAPAVYVPS